MTSQPDKLFRDKLENFQRPAPAAAWDRIEKNISKPVYKLVWVRIAAGIVLLSAAAVLLWPAANDQSRVAETNVQPVVTPVDTVTQVHTEKEEAAPAQRTATRKFNSVPQPAFNTPAVANLETPVEKSEQPVKDSLLIITPTPKELVAEVVIPQPTETSTTIVYTSDEVKSKFLKKKLSPEATPENKDASGIQKLIGLAYAAKNSEAGLADLRQKKDELLALNFGKKKGEN